jgi:hypothetical protein
MMLSVWRLHSVDLLLISELLRTCLRVFAKNGSINGVLGYRSGGPGSIPGTTKKKLLMGLERGPFSLVSTTEELLDRKVAAPV